VKRGNYSPQQISFRAPGADSGRHQVRSFREPVMRHHSLPQRVLLLVPIVGAALLFAGCPPQAPVAPAPPSGPAAAGGHHHAHGEKGPHDGALVAIGDGAAHLEVVLDAETGKVTAYVLDGSAQNPVTITAEKLQIDFTVTHSHAHEADEKKADETKEGDEKPKEENEAKEDKDEDKVKEELPEARSVTLTPVSPADDGSTSVFEGVSEDLKGVEEFDAVLTAITIAGKAYENVKFKYPEGNEHDHHH
jgi:hypothetical protein